MGNVIFDVSISLDGFMTASNRRSEEPMGDGNEWALRTIVTERFSRRESLRRGRVVKEIDLELGDDRTLRVYDTAADDADGRLAVFWHHGSPNIGAPPSPSFRPQKSSASAGCRTTGPGTADLPPARTGTWHRRPLMSRTSPTL